MSPKVPSSFIISATTRGDIEELQRFYDVGWISDINIADIVDQACKDGVENVLVWLKSKPGFRYRSDAVSHAAANGHLNIVVWFHDNVLGISYANYVAVPAAKNGQIHILQWLKDNISTLDGGKWLMKDAFDTAAINGRIEVLQWFKNNLYNFCCNPTAVNLVLGNKSTETLQWLIDNTPAIIYSSDGVYWAVNKDDVRTLQLLNEHTQGRVIFRYLSSIIIHAVRGSRERVLDWILDHIYPRKLLWDSKNLCVARDCKCHLDRNLYYKCLSPSSRIWSTITHPWRQSHRVTVETLLLTRIVGGHDNILIIVPNEILFIIFGFL